MREWAKKLIPVLIAAVMLFNMNLCVSAAELRAGSVKGLPEKLVVLDDNGQSVSENGEYYFEVENMQAGETYTKKIQIMNLREDAAYKITFRAQPLTNEGEIDLENECVCNIHLDSILVYHGKVTGEGTPDIRDNAMSLGLYKPGESHVMTVDITWNGSSAGGFIDNGARIVDRNGSSVIREESGNHSISGETTFKWIFYAEVRDVHGDDSDTSIIEISSPDIEYPSQISFSGDGNDGHNNNNDNHNIIDFVTTGDTIAYCIMGLAAVAMVSMILIAVNKKKKKKKQT